MTAISVPVSRFRFGLLTLYVSHTIAILGLSLPVSCIGPLESCTAVEDKNQKLSEKGS